MEKNKIAIWLVCPECNSAKVSTERRLDGDSKCLDCEHKDKTANFKVCKVTKKQVVKMEESNDFT